MDKSGYREQSELLLGDLGFFLLGAAGLLLLSMASGQGDRLHQRLAQGTDLELQPGHRLLKVTLSGHISNE